MGTAVPHLYTVYIDMDRGYIMTILRVDEEWGQQWHRRVGRYYTLGEVCQYDPARVVPNAAIRANVLTLARHLDAVRDAWGSAIIITSWYRPAHVNRRVGGAPNSQHIRGSAADIRPAHGDGVQFERWLDSRWPYALGYGQQSGRGFTHVDLRSGRLRWSY